MKKPTMLSLLIAVMLLGSLLSSCSSKAPAGGAKPKNPKEGITSFEMYCDSIQDTFVIDISLPNNYETDTDKHYPVLYMTDGYWRYDEHRNIHRFSGEGKLQEMIVVGIGYPDTHDYGSIRRRDLIDGADKFLAFIVDELIPEIDAQYRTDPADRTLSGHSNGGYFGAYTLLQAHDKSKGVFKNIIFSSPTLESLTNGRSIPEMEETLYQNTRELPVNVFMTVGNLESYEFYVNPFLRFEERLKSRQYQDLKLISYVANAEDHSTLGQKALYQGLVYFLGTEKSPN